MPDATVTRIHSDCILCAAKGSRDPATVLGAFVARLHQGESAGDILCDLCEFHDGRVHDIAVGLEGGD